MPPKVWRQERQARYVRSSPPRPSSFWPPAPYNAVRCQCAGVRCKAHQHRQGSAVYVSRPAPKLQACRNAHYAHTCRHVPTQCMYTTGTSGDESSGRSTSMYSSTLPGTIRACLAGVNSFVTLTRSHKHTLSQLTLKHTHSNLIMPPRLVVSPLPGSQHG